MKVTDRLRLAMVGLNPGRLRRLRDEFESDAGLLRAMRAGRVASPDIPNDEEITERLVGIDVLYRGDGRYPVQLAALPDAPDVLFVRGTLPDGPAVAVVGTRKCTSYGRRLAGAVGRALGGVGWAVVSGLARGIDGAAHAGSLESGSGVAVLGTGVDVIYPREHASLVNQLLDSGGGLVSEYPPGSRPDAWRFPPRNRIISGLAAAVVVVEAPVKGGSLITATHALEQGRPLFAVPGDIDREVSRGCNLLIRDGAFPVVDIDDLVTGLSFILGPPPAADAGRVTASTLRAALGTAGCGLDELVERLAIPTPEVLAMVARAEAGGEVVYENGWVSPR